MTAEEYAAYAMEVLTTIGDNDDSSLEEYFIGAFKAGMQEMKEQMIKKAVDARITLLEGISFVSKDVLSKFKPGEKVKLIIIKTD